MCGYKNAWQGMVVKTRARSVVPVLKLALPNRTQNGCFRLAGAGFETGVNSESAHHLCQYPADKWQPSG
jgi:hypothetical protein